MTRLLFALLSAAVVSPLGAATDDALFRGQVAPIFEQRCVNCHHGNKPKGGLSLTTRAAMLAGGDSGPAIVPGRSAEGLLMEYISGEEPEMPKGGAALLPDQIAVLRRWIDAGAPWPDGVELKNAQRADKNWWAFQPIVRPQPPAVKDLAWIKSPIDAFVLAGLENRKLAPAPAADKITLLRRATYDLIGLPPTPSEVAEFLSDESPQAFATVVDRLLASPHYGERWGRHWLDVTHYADTHGFESDGKRPNAWRYRDYVIQAFNDDKPFDRFLSEQIAADVVAADDPRAIAALGFLGTGSWDKIGHEAKAAELRRKARADELDDIVTTVAASTLGLTVNCARCHDHKFDPLPQRDYYRLWAVFSGVKHGDRPLRPDNDQQRRKRSDELAEQLAAIKVALGRAIGAPLDLADVVAGGNGFGSGQRDHGFDPRSGQPTTGKQGILTGLETNKFVKAKSAFIDGTVIPGSASPGESGVRVPISSTGLVLESRPTDGQSWDYIQSGPVLSQDKSEIGGVDYSAAGHSMIGLHANKALTFDLDAIRRAYPEYRAPRFSGIAAYGGLGAGASADFAVVVDGHVRAERKNLDYAQGAVPIDVPLAADDRFLTLVATDGGNGIAFDQIFFGDPHLSKQATETAADPTDSPRQTLLDRQRVLEQELAGLSSSETVYAVVDQAQEVVHVLKRGDPEAPGDEATPGGLSVLGGLSSDFGTSDLPDAERRAALARWLVDPANPLVRRVVVNRLWHYHFGTGIVSTPSDFGFNGDRPSHPELLDWLAAELLDCGWSVKKLHRQIMLSSVYQQASAQNPAAEAVDSGNRALWKMSRRRLEAELVRDAMLAVSGKLNRQYGGPGYEDFEYIEKYAPVYKYVVADRPELWRRTVYRFAVRSVPDQWMEALDCPNPSILVPARGRTTTALQALSLLNNPFVVQQAGYFAERVAREAGDDPKAQVQLAYRLALARDPGADELTLARQFVSEQGLFTLCHMLFNANEFIYVD